ncbi:MAG: DUF1638 domain-containing protein [Chloroflexota bacterium]
MREVFMENGRIKVIACATVIEEMLPLMPPDLDYEVLDFGLHLVPGSLKLRLQEAIDAACPEYDIIILGYGLCSMAVVGLESRNCTIVVPRVDDCIACFLGSREAYDAEHQKEPGTYYLTKGWIEVSDTLLDEYNRSVEKYGQSEPNASCASCCKIISGWFTLIPALKTRRITAICPQGCRKIQLAF